jgi:hypothetical protein
MKAILSVFWTGGAGSVELSEQDAKIALASMTMAPHAAACMKPDLLHIISLGLH